MIDPAQIAFLHQSQIKKKVYKIKKFPLQIH